MYIKTKSIIINEVFPYVDIRYKLEKHKSSTVILVNHALFYLNVSWLSYTRYNIIFIVLLTILFVSSFVFKLQYMQLCMHIYQNVKSYKWYNSTGDYCVCWLLYYTFKWYRCKKQTNNNFRSRNILDTSKNLSTTRYYLVVDN